MDARYLLLLSFALGPGQVTCKLQVLLLNFVRQDRKTFRKKINFSLLLRERISKNFTWYPMNMTFSISAGKNRHYTLCCVSQRDHSLWEFWVVFPSNTVELYTCMSWSALSWIVKGILCRSLEFSVCVSRFSILFCELLIIWPTWTSSFSLLNLGRLLDVWPKFPSLHHSL